MPQTLPPAIMFQGTCSSAGKSLLATAFCRLLARRHLRVAPFKAQNMSLNSFVTPKGEEIGRAQALQAEACFQEPSALMNPVLLKPAHDHTSHIIRLGRPYGVLKSQDFLQRREDLWKTVQEAYVTLAENCDVVVLEGAGSPAEINLRDHDIVNMRMAQFAEASVILVADIDRGGAFAALTGTMQLLLPDERARVLGFILNKFRGDASLLETAVHEVSRITKRPFLGIMPWIPDLNLPDEDSVSFKEKKNASRSDALEILLLDLPHISNTTDFDALSHEDDISLQKVSRLEDWHDAPCVIIPGSRSTADDLTFLRESRLDQCLVRYAQKCLAQGSGMLIGICAGYQMLGEVLDDPCRIEHKESIPCLSILPIRTTISEEKTLGQKTCVSSPMLTHDPLPVTGYEIHHGKSFPTQHTLHIVLEDKEKRPLGFGLPDKKGHIRVWGTYLHGIFDSDAFRNVLLNEIRHDANKQKRIIKLYRKDDEINRLADIFEKNIQVNILLDNLGIL